MNEKSTFSYENAWKYFEIHSQQRMTIFNFYITIVGLLAAGCGVSLQQGGGYIYFSTPIGIFISFVTLIFYKLDDRTSKLIKRSEKVLAKFEMKYASSSEGIFTSEDSDINKGFLSTWTYGRCFRLVYITLANAGVILSLMPLCFSKLN